MSNGGVPCVPLSLELQPVNEPAVFESDACSDIRMDLLRESLIGAWATFVTITHRMRSQANRNPTSIDITTKPSPK